MEENKEKLFLYLLAFLFTMVKSCLKLLITITRNQKRFSKIIFYLQDFPWQRKHVSHSLLLVSPRYMQYVYWKCFVVFLTFCVRSTSFFFPQLISKCELWETSGRAFMSGNEKSRTTDGQCCTVSTVRHSKNFCQLGDHMNTWAKATFCKENKQKVAGSKKKLRVKK